LKQSIADIQPRISIAVRKMVREYMTELYRGRRTRRTCASSRRITAWYAKEPVGTRASREVWDRVKFVEAGPGPGRFGDQRQTVPWCRPAIDLAGLTPGDVRVEAVIWARG